MISLNATTDTDETIVAVGLTDDDLANLRKGMLTVDLATLGVDGQVASVMMFAAPTDDDLWDLVFDAGWISAGSPPTVRAA